MDEIIATLSDYLACRSCCTFFLDTSYLRYIFSPELAFCREVLASWNIPPAENDELPPYLCINCIQELSNAVELQNCTIQTQQSLQLLNNMKYQNAIAVKTEPVDYIDITEPSVEDDDNDQNADDDENICQAFIYSDESSSESENDAATPQCFVYSDESSIEAATVPDEDCFEIKQELIEENYVTSEIISYL